MIIGSDPFSQSSNQELGRQAEILIVRLKSEGPPPDLLELNIKPFQGFT